MGWASKHIEKLLCGETVQFRPHGNSMTGKISSGQLCTVEPITDYTTLTSGDIVLCRVNGNVYLHLISAVKLDKFQISNNHGHVNGVIGYKNIFGKCIKVEN